MDQMNRRMVLPIVPERVVSLVPSITEYLIDLNVNVVGRTKFCLHPKGRIDSIPIVGGTKKFHPEKIEDLKPDLVVGNKEENYEEGIDLLNDRFPVWMSDVPDILSALDMMEKLGAIVGRKDEAKDVIRRTKGAFSLIKDKEKGSVLYFIWKSPWMVAGSGTYIDAVLQHCGLVNCIRETRYPELSHESLARLKPDHIFFSSEPYPFKDNHVLEFQQLFPGSKIKLVDGELYSWYGSRLANLIQV